MAMIATRLKIEEERVVPALQEAGEKLNGGGGEVVLDFSSVFRIDPGAVGAMEAFAKLADAKAVRVVLRDVNVNVYKVLKLVKLAPRFSFVSGDAQSPDEESCHAELSTKRPPFLG